MMPEEKHQHLFHHHKDEDKTVKSGYADDEVDYKEEEKQHKHFEHLGVLGAMATGAYALHEKHKAEKDTEHAHKYKLERGDCSGSPEAVVLYSMKTWHEKKEAKKEDEEARGKKHHPDLLV